MESSPSWGVRDLPFSSVHPACIRWAQQWCRWEVLPQMLLGEPDHPGLLLTTVQSCCPIHGTAALVSPSPNQLLLGSFQRFCCRGAGTGSKASKCKWVDVSPDPSPNLRGDSWSRHLAYWHKLISFSPLNSLPGSSRTPGSPHQGSFGITSAQLEN